MNGCVAYDEPCNNPNAETVTAEGIEKILKFEQFG